MSRAAVRSAGSAAPCPWTLRRVTSTPAVVTAGARRRNAALAPVYQLPVTQRDQPDGRTMREGGAPSCRVPPKSGASGTQTSEGNCLPNRYLRSSGRGGKAGTPTGRTPCLPRCLPDWVPVTFRDREPAGMLRREVHPLSADLIPSQLTATAHLTVRAS
jgi:hypothetical protein